MGRLMPRLMPNPDITVILLMVMAIMDMDTVSPDIASLILEVASWERGQLTLRLMPNLDFMVIPMVMAFTDLITDTVLMDLVSLDTLPVLLSPTEAPEVLASKSAISDI